MTDCAWECDRVLKIVLCVNCWKGVFKLPPSGEICIWGDFKYRQKIRKDRSDGKKVALFGSYDWGDGEWMRTWCGRAKDAGAELVDDEGLIVNNTPDDEGLAACRELGGKLA